MPGSPPDRSTPERQVPPAGVVEGGDGAGGRGSHAMLRAAEWFGMHAPRGLGVTAAETVFPLVLRRARQREIVAANLARVLGHPPEHPVVRSATRECFRLYARYWYETFALRRMPVEEVNRRFTMDGMEHLEAAREGGRGGIMVLPHMGNWDAAGHWLCLQGFRMTAVA